MLGASVYLSQENEDIIKYLEKMQKYGVKTIFTSMHIIEDDNDEAVDRIKMVSQKINSLKMELMVDISDNTMKKFNMTFDEIIKFFEYINVKSLRIDFGFNFDQIKKLSEHFNIVLNASTINDDYCNKLISAGMDLHDITACHNFYPRVETGLSEKFLLEKNKYLKEKGFKIQAFIPGDKIKRGPLEEGLPTLEKHRHSAPLISYIELKKDFMVDEVLIGDISIKEESLKPILLYEKDKLIELHVENLLDLTDAISEVFWITHKNRLDYSEYVIRSTMPRVQIKEKVKAENTIERKVGSITIDNEKYLRYNGEIQIALKELNADERVNVLGKVVDEDIPLLKYIIDEVKFRFVK